MLSPHFLSFRLQRYIFCTVGGSVYHLGPAFFQGSSSRCHCVYEPLTTTNIKNMTYRMAPAVKLAGVECLTLMIPSEHLTLMFPSDSLTLTIPSERLTLMIPSENLTLMIPSERLTLMIPSERLTLMFLLFFLKSSSRRKFSKQFTLSSRLNV